MTASLYRANDAILDSIQFHRAWLEGAVGLEAEKLLRGKKPYLYVLRAGEASSDGSEAHYYVTYVGSDLKVVHQPFTVTIRSEGWYCENGDPYGPLDGRSTIDEVLHLMMHCEKGECAPFVRS